MTLHAGIWNIPMKSCTYPWSLRLPPVQFTRVMVASLVSAPSTRAVYRSFCPQCRDGSIWRCSFCRPCCVEWFSRWLVLRLFPLPCHVVCHAFVLKPSPLKSCRPRNCQEPRSQFRGHSHVLLRMTDCWGEGELKALLQPNLWYTNKIFTKTGKSMHVSQWNAASKERCDNIFCKAGQDTMAFSSIQAIDWLPFFLGMILSLWKHRSTQKEHGGLRETCIFICADKTVRFT